MYPYGGLGISGFHVKNIYIYAAPKTTIDTLIIRVYYDRRIYDG